MCHIGVNVMGSGSASLAFAYSTSKSKIRPDATTRALNDFRLTQAQSLPTLGPSIRPLLSLGRLDEGTRNILGLLGRKSTERGLTANEFYRNATERTNNAYSRNLDFISDEIAPNLLDAGQSYYSQILRPEIANNAALLGLSRSGAQIEAQAKGAASIALPLSQTIAGLQGQQLQGRAEAIRGFNQQLPEVDVNTRNAYLQRLGIGAQARDYSRQQRLDARETYANLLTSFINATPYTAGSTTRGRSFSVSGSVSYGGSGGGGGNAGYFGGS